MYKSFKTISDNITEEEYRNDGRMHYSTLATYARGGFNAISTLFERKESPSLLFGSCVDTLITGSQKDFDELYLVADIPQMSPSLINIINDLYSEYGLEYDDLSSLSNNVLAEYWDKYDARNWKAETKAKFIIDNGNNYYRLKHIAGNKTVISNELYIEVLNTVEELRNSESTKWYFTEDPFDDTVERLYQLKFHDTIDGIDYSCMADLIVVDHTHKIVYPCDLKTSSHKEYDFFKSFIDWSYHIQARQYWRLIRNNMDRDEVFKTYKLADYRFIVVNKNTLNPLVWEYPDTTLEGTLYYGKDSNIECKYPCDLGKELKYYIDNIVTVPLGIQLNAPNNLNDWLKTL
jgi:hypothetical protein